MGRNESGGKVCPKGGTTSPCLWGILIGTLLSDSLMWLLRRRFPEKYVFVCCVQTPPPAPWLPLLFPAWAALPVWAGSHPVHTSPWKPISDAAREWRCAHLRSARRKPAGSERWMAGTSRRHPPFLTLLPAGEEWARTAPNFTCYTTFGIYSSFFRVLPAYRLTVILILFWCLVVTQIQYSATCMDAYK